MFGFLIDCPLELSICPVMEGVAENKISFSKAGMSPVLRCLQPLLASMSFGILVCA